MTKESKTWLIYFSTILVSVFVHELGHCIPAWAHGLRAIPTPAKQYSLDAIPANVQLYVSLGGLVGNGLVTVLGILFFVVRKNELKSAILAGVLASPALYVLRFLLQGRGHDATEFQEAQAALGLSYEGHAADWYFVVMLTAGVVVWLLQTKLAVSMIWRILLGVASTLIFLIALQKINNWLFDRFFQ